MKTFVGNAEKLTEINYIEAAEVLNCEVAAIKAFAKVEAGGKSGFLSQSKRPKILFESKWFHRLTKGNYDSSHPKISTTRWVRNYLGGEREYTRLEEAMNLDSDAALKSTSWGLFQVMGFNHEVAGFDTVVEMVEAIKDSEGEHLFAFVNFIINNHLDDELRNKNWGKLAYGYNGKGYRKNKYDEKMADAYESIINPSKHKGKPSTMDIQLALIDAGAIIKADGIKGKGTRLAIKEFQHKHDLTADGIVGRNTLKALGF